MKSNEICFKANAALGLTIQTKFCQFAGNGHLKVEYSIAWLESFQMAQTNGPVIL
uniref:Uncharacterized protein n=1 Tax=Anguilla anguilla TaxID=7936 RepID=A0A0E9T6L2_ANGAN